MYIAVDRIFTHPAYHLRV